MDDTRRVGVMDIFEITEQLSKEYNLNYEKTLGQVWLTSMKLKIIQPSMYAFNSIKRNSEVYTRVKDSLEKSGAYKKEQKHNTVMYINTKNIDDYTVNQQH